jgi:hypothetical protein
MIMNRPNETAASVHHFRFSAAKSRAFTGDPPPGVGDKLVVTKLARASRSRQTAAP